MSLSNNMIDKERFIRTLKFQKTDRPIFTEFLGFWPETINKWYSQGLPFTIRNDGEGKVAPFYVTVGVSSYFKGISEYLKFDRCYHATNSFDIDFGPIPRFIRKTLEENERYRIEVDEAGIVKKTLLTDVSIPGWIEFPIKNKEDFEEIKKRYRPHDVVRYPKNWGNELFSNLKNTDAILAVTIPGFFGQPRSFLGLERLLKFMYIEKGFVHKILDFWEDFVIETLSEPLRFIKFDYAYIWEDMCYINGPLISPKLFEEYILPHYKKTIHFLREHGVEIIMVDSDGDCRKLIPLMIEGGVNCLTPLEIASFMDPVKIREEFGRKLSIIGGIDKRALIKGGASIDKEVKKRVLPLVEEGGFIASVDHKVPYDVSFSNYLHYLNVLKKALAIKK